jgi:phospholipase D1/2
VIHDSKHFVYIENQFFITATSDSQHPVKNKIGAAIVERVLRAHKAGETYKMIICLPSVPGFAGDLHSDDALGTRAIMEFQYNSICKGDTSILGALKKAGVTDPSKYIRFFNLRNYDRINANETMSKVENTSNIKYREAQMEHDDVVGAGYGSEGYGTGAVEGQKNPKLDGYQHAASQVLSKYGTKYDTVSECNMENGPSIKDIPWEGSEEDEMNAFVSEELYIHTKLLIADDRIVICGSANLNDRSQLGYHDSEIAVVVEDTTLVDSKMNGQQYKAAQFAAGLRRQIFRKHLGLLPPQDWTKPTDNFLPINKAPNTYDWNSSSDRLVQDPLSPDFEQLYKSTAKTNTEVFAKAFHCVPDDRIRNWDQYDEFYSKHFLSPDKHGKYTEVSGGGKYQYGHVVREGFPGGVKELKESLDRVRGSLVEMPLNFMLDVDFAHGLALNALTEPIYT